MATLILTAIGTAFGGPIGGAIGALAGRSLDGAIIGGGKREGPRLRELAVTTSSYGQAIPRHHGRMRAAGTIIWATDLVEHKDRQGGKKGRPSVTTYSYSTSFAVALSSRPIRGIGRIWADGNLLRGEGGDLKAAGTLRIHTGHGDQTADPLIAAAQGEHRCPAYRGCAYAVFEDLALEDFGNRIPALTFEVIADDGAVSLADLARPLADVAMEGGGVLAPLAGYSWEGGPIGAALATIDALFPLACDAGGERLTIAPRAVASETPPMLPLCANGWDDDDGNNESPSGIRETRDDADRAQPDALRYYDVARDFQPGVQRPGGKRTPGRSVTIEFPGALAADDARTLADDAARRSSWRGEMLTWRLAGIDPAIAPGVEVRVPDRPGRWRVEGWEWRSRGVELDLVRMNPRALAGPSGDAGTIPSPDDLAFAPTTLFAFETPPATPDGREPTLFAAATAAGGGKWTGSALFLDRAGSLVPIGTTGRERATIGTLVADLAPSNAIHFEPTAHIEVALSDPDAGFAPATLAAIAQGANRLLVGGEVLQYARAEPTSRGTWILSGLLRGRGGSEPAALRGHRAGSVVVLLDETLIALDPAIVPSHPATTIAGIGAGDAEPVFATLANPGLGSRPPSPVHPRSARTADDGIFLSWTRRARGAWHWLDEVDVPLVEEFESYRIGIGPLDAPIAEWLVSEPSLVILPGQAAALAQVQPEPRMWVRQIGRFAQSDPLFLPFPA